MHYTWRPTSWPIGTSLTAYRGEGRCGCFPEGFGLYGERNKMSPDSFLWLPFSQHPRWPWLWPTPPSLPVRPLPTLAETLLRQRSGNLLFQVPTLGRKQFREGNCKLAFVVKRPTPGLGWQGQWSQSPRLPPAACQCLALFSGWLRLQWPWLCLPFSNTASPRP